MNVTEWFAAITRDDEAVVAAHASRFARAIDENGDSGLMQAAAANSERCAEILARLEAGMRNARGETAMEIAIKTHSIGCVKVLADLEGSLPFSNGELPLPAAIRFSVLEALPFLTPQYKFLRDGEGRTPLDLAAQLGSLAAIQTLVVTGQPYPQENIDSAMEYARAAGQMAAVKGIPSIVSRYLCSINAQRLAGAPTLLGEASNHSSIAIRTASEIAMAKAECSARMADESSKSATSSLRSSSSSLDGELVTIPAQELAPMQQPIQVDLPRPIGITQNADLELQSAQTKILALEAEMRSLRAQNESLRTQVMTPSGLETSQLATSTPQAFTSPHDRVATTFFNDMLLSTQAPTSFATPTRDGRQASRSTSRSAYAHVRSHYGRGYMASPSRVGGMKQAAIRECRALTRAISVQPTPRPAESELILAVKSGDLPRARAFLVEQACEQDPQGRTALMHAIERNQTAIIRDLVLREAGIQDKVGITGMMIAARLNQPLTVASLITHEQRLQRTTDGWTALMIAASAGNIDCVDILAKYEAGLRNTEGTTALIEAIKNDKRRCAIYLWAYEGSIPDGDGTSPREWAVRFDRTIILAYMDRTPLVPFAP